MVIPYQIGKSKALSLKESPGRRAGVSYNVKLRVNATFKARTSKYIPSSESRVNLYEPQLSKRPETSALVVKNITNQVQLNDNLITL